MHFYVKEYKSTTSSTKEYPCVELTTDHWDDWSMAQTLFHATYQNESDGIFNQKVLGDIKIMTTENPITRRAIPKYFTKLSDSYCSVGQDLEFYKTLSELPKDIYYEVLDGLRDCATNESIANKFDDNSIFNESLLRFSEAEKAFKEAKKYFGGDTKEKKLAFAFKYKLEGAGGNHEVDLDFNVDVLPYRINAIVGKNATGKTKILTELASHISGVKKNNENFSPRRPLFSKIIALSYSAFDELYKPFDDYHDMENTLDSNEESELFSYKYCGLRNKEGLLSLQDLERNFFESFSTVSDRKRVEQWQEIMLNVFGEEHLELIMEVKDTPKAGKLVEQLSSGQSILLSTITDVIAHIEEDSLLLFDEPELHLHPNAIANFMRMYYEILEKFNSFSVISTHSPIILQEIPSKYIRVFSRFGNIPIIERPSLECFGENISSITNDVFEVREHESNYKTILKKLSQTMDKDALIDLFEDELSFNALTYLNSVYKRNDVK